MKKFLLTSKEINTFQDLGFIFIDYRFSTEELFALNKASNELEQLSLEANVAEENSQFSRTIRGIHLYHPLLKRLCSHPA
ncbi:TPA: hypothetical protein ACG70Y_003169, partial [Legionella pneumophila]